MNKHGCIAGFPPGWLRGLLVTVALAFGLSAVLSDPIDRAGPDEPGIPFGEQVPLTRSVSYGSGPARYRDRTVVQKRASHAQVGWQRSGLIIRDVPSGHGADSPAISVTMPATVSASTTSTDGSATVGPYAGNSKPAAHPEVVGPDPAPGEDRQVTSAISKPGRCRAGRGRCYVVNLMSSSGPVAMPAPGSLVDAQRYVIYTSNFDANGGNWKRLRVGFFVSRSDAQALADALKEQYPGAWVTTASDDEMASASAQEPARRAAENRPPIAAGGQLATLPPSAAAGCVTGRGHCYAVNLASSIQPVVIPRVHGSVDAKRYVIYTSRFNHDGGNWKRLRLGFFDSRSDAQAVADALSKQYPQAWVAVTSDEEVATALATQESKVEMAALEPVSAAQPAAAEGRAATTAGPPAEDHVLRYPGYMWSQVREPSDVYDEDGNSIVEGAIQQGIDWMRLGSNAWLNTFAELGLKRDSDELDWNNENKLSVGGKLRYFGLKQSLVSVGVRYDLVNRTKSKQNREGLTYFADWYSYWNLSDLAGSGSGGSSLPLGFPGTTWGQLRYPASQFGEETRDTLVEGAIEQGIDWLRFSERSFFNTFVEVGYTFDSKGLEWNNKIKWAPGAKVKAFVAKKALLEVGAMYRSQYRTKPNQTKSDPVVFLNWSTSWDFGEFARKSFGNPQ